MIYVRITFETPDDNGSPITAYHVQFLKADGEFSTSNDCDASLIQVGTKWQCEVSFTELRA